MSEGSVAAPALPNRPSGEAPEEKKHAIPWTVICVVGNFFIAVAVLFRSCGPVDFDWRFADKKAVSETLAESEKKNREAHETLQQNLTTVTNDVSAIKTEIGSINTAIKDEILTRLPKAKRRGR